MASVSWKRRLNLNLQLQVNVLEGWHATGEVCVCVCSGVGGCWGAVGVHCWEAASETAVRGVSEATGW